jgi:hypothetical protein
MLHFLAFRILNSGQNPKNTEILSYIPSSEPFRIYLYNRCGSDVYHSFRKLECLKIQLAKTLSHVSFLMRCKFQGLIPVKTPVSSRCYSRIVQNASQALLRDRIHFRWYNEASQLHKIQQPENFLKLSAEGSFRNIFNK